MRVLVTRPRDDATETAARLRVRGHEAIVAPLIEIRLRLGADVDLEGVRAILATSVNGARAFARRTSRRDIEILAVGDRTAQVARSAGFARVRSASGDARALAATVPQWAVPGDGALLRVSGADVEDSLGAELRKRGYTVRSTALYDAVAATNLPRAAVDALQQGTIDAVVFFSPRSARIFADCVVRAGEGRSRLGAIACCIGAAAAEALAPLQFAAVRIAPHPDEEHVLDLLDLAL